MFSFICKLSFSTSWNSTLESFKNELIQDGFCCCCCCRFSLTLSSFGRCFLNLIPCSSFFNTLLIFYLLSKFLRTKNIIDDYIFWLAVYLFKKVIFKKGNHLILISNKREWNNCVIENAHKIWRILPDFICKNNQFSACF